MPITRSPCQQHASVRMSRNTAHVACGACGGRAGKWVSGEVAVHLGPPVLDKVERSWSCWRHPNASGVGVNVACAMGNTRFSRAPWDFLLLNVGLRFFETSSVRPAPRPRRGPPRPRHAAPLPTRDAGVTGILQMAAGGSIRARTRVAGAARRDGRLTAAACRSHGSPVTPLFLIAHRIDQLA